MSRFKEFKTAYQKLVVWGVAEEICDKELFLYYMDAQMNHPALNEQWEDEEVYRYFSGVDDKEILS